MCNKYVKLVESLLYKESIYPIEILNKNSLDERKIEELINDTDKERLRKSDQEVKRQPPKTIDVGDEREKLMFNVKSVPSRDGKRQQGYLIHRNGEVLRMFCTCSDFYYRLYDSLVQAGLATYEIEDEYKRQLVGPLVKVPRAENGTKLSVCKHLASLRRYI